MKKRLGMLFMSVAACMGYASDAGAVSICIDPGHGGSDPGAMGCSLQEAEINLAVALFLKPLLQSAGYTVIMTRTTDATVSLAGRAELANSNGVTTFASIHTNSATATATGTETFCYLGNSGKAGGTQAKNIQAQMISAWGLANRGQKEADFYVVRETNMPATLTELGFINNCSVDATFLGNTDQRKKAARAHCLAITSQWGGNASACEGSGGSTVQTGKVLGFVTDGATAGAGNKLDGATYTCGGKTVTSSSSAVSTFEIPAGSYTCSASKSGYNSNTRTDCAAVTAGGQAWCSVNIQPSAVVPAKGNATGTVKDSTTKSNIAATVTVSGGSSIAYNGSTEWVFSLDAGTYTIKASASGYDDNSVSCVVTSGQTTSCPIVLNPKKATLHGNITDKATGAKVAGSVTLGDSTVTYDAASDWSFSVAAGSYTITASVPGYKAASVNCSAGKGETATCNIEVEKEKSDDPPGMLRGTLSNVMDNTLIAGSVSLENGDLAYYNGTGAWQFYLEPGMYQVTGNAEGYESSTVTCGVTSGQETNCPIKLKPLSVDINGRVYDPTTNENITASVAVKNAAGETVAEFDYEGLSNWQAQLVPGTYTIIATPTMEGYIEATSTCIVIAGKPDTCSTAVYAEGTELGIMLGNVHDARSASYLIPATVTIQGMSAIDYNPRATDCEDEVCKTWKTGQIPVGAYSVTASAPGYYDNVVTCVALGEEAGVSVCKIPLTVKSGGEDAMNLEAGADPTIFIKSDGDCSASPLTSKNHPLTLIALLMAAAAAWCLRRRTHCPGE